MASLQELLADDGFERSKRTPARTHRKVKFKDREDSNIALPIYICHDRRSSLDFSKNKSRRPFSTTTSSVHSSQKSNVKSTHLEGNIPRRDEPAIDEIAIRAVISILSGFVGQYSRDKDFREAIKEKCYACFVGKKNHSDNGIFADIELAIESIERLVDSIDDSKREVKVKSLQYSIRLLTIVASLDSNNSGNGSTCGIPNSNLSACAQLYLSIIYKLEKNDRIAARHLLQVFVDSPYLARTHLLPELWEHLFLPHLLHLKIWHTQELEVLSSSNYADKEKQMKAINKLYNDHLDIGTTKFALYYKQWLKVGAQAPAVPSVPLPSKVGYSTSRRRSMDSLTSNSSVKNNSLYRAVFGPMTERKSMDAARKGIWDYEVEEEEKISASGDDFKQGNYTPKAVVHRRSSSQSNTTPKHDQWDHTHKKTDRFRFFNCQSEPVECLIEGNSKIGSVSIRKEEKIIPAVSNDLGRAIFAICSSDSLSECELAIRLVAKSWLDSHGDPETVKRLSTTPVIEGIVNVLFASEDDEILELAISILAELVTRKETNGQIILNSDPQLDIFLRLLRSSSLFLKAAILLYLVQPKAKQMISFEWIPLVLRVLEFADQLQTLFTVQRSPQEAAYYLLDQLLTGFDVNKNFENCKQVISLGGLNLLLRRVETGDVSEKSKVASVMYYCVQSDGSCRHYLAKKLNKDYLLPLLLLQNQQNARGHVFAFLTELFCIDKQIQRIEFLRGLLNGWGMVNTLHVLLLYLQRAQQEERPIISAILLQLDLLGDPNECSVYREEVIEELIKALDCQVFNEKVQVQTARALLILGSCFSYAGEPVVEQRLLKEAGYDENAGNSYLGKNFILNSYTNLNEEEESTRNWQRKTAIVLLNSGNKRLLSGLVDSIANGIPCLGRASLVTVTWMSNFSCFIEDKGVRSLVYSELIPELMKLLKYNNAIEERVLASLSLVRLANNSDYLAKLSPLDKELISNLHKLSEVTWTAKELISIISSRSKPQQLNVP
ncbi:unnamed protein product [Withania somnifera]